MSENTEVLLCECHRHQEQSTWNENYPLPTYISLPATWFAIVDSEMFTSITSATKYRIESYEYIGTHGDRIIHACEDCIVRLRGVIPGHITMTYYKDGLNLQYRKKCKRKGLYKKIYMLGTEL